MAVAPHWIALDWGTSNMRAWAMDADDCVLARTTGANGMGQLAPQDFEPALIDAVGAWLNPNRRIPVVACGMIGARQGWIEAPYAQVPTPPMANVLTRAPTSDPRFEVLIVPGVSQASPADVMRGEETQIAGYVSRVGGSGVICLPGTHSKWVELSGDRIVRFRTAMTGELFALLAERSVLRHSVASPEWDDGAFSTGVADSLDNAAILNNLFAIRAQSLLEGARADAQRARLSGLLIGAELAGARSFWHPGPVWLIGEPDLSELYRIALEIAGGSARILDAEEMTLAGLCAARQRLKE